MRGAQLSPEGSRHLLSGYSPSPNVCCVESNSEDVNYFLTFYVHYKPLQPTLHSTKGHAIPVTFIGTFSMFLTNKYTSPIDLHAHALELALYPDVKGRGH